MVLYNLGKSIFSLCLILLDRQNGNNDECKTLTKIPIQNTTIFFEKNGVVNYSMIVFDSGSKQILLAATDHIFRLKLLNLELSEEAKWPPTNDVVQTCSASDKSEGGCRNHINSLHIVGDKVFACGTYAHNPKCSWRKFKNISAIDSTISGYQRTSFKSQNSVTSLIVDGNYYVGTSLDALGINSGILRINEEDKLSNMETELEKSWLWEPDFVSSFHSTAFVYFFFNEKGTDDSAFQEDKYPRIARVCKGDRGSTAYRVRSTWLTFQKARLLCSLGSTEPFHFNHLQSIVHIPDKNLFYGLFTTSDAALGGSAVCIFNMNDASKTFDGPFSILQERSCKRTRHQESDMSSYHCKQPGLSEERKKDPPRSLKYQLMANPFKPNPSFPVLVSKFDMFDHMAVMFVQTRESGSVTVVFLVTNEGLVSKLRIFPESKTQDNFCILYIYHLFPEGSKSRVLTMKYLDETKSLYFGTSDKLLQVDVASCDRFKSEESCLSSDPHCGWHKVEKRCVSAPKNDIKDPNWSQSALKCPAFSLVQVEKPIDTESSDGDTKSKLSNGTEVTTVPGEPVNGGWSKWSNWQKCERKSSRSSKKRTKRRVRGKCLFRERKCDNPKPVGAGAPCEGLRIQIGGSGGRSGESSVYTDCISIINVVSFTLIFYLKIFSISPL
ncbi:UNVERIFIED_CONTAM: hypothetical protein RMT77_015386 [Armadillidium vulgare]